MCSLNPVYTRAATYTETSYVVIFVFCMIKIASFELSFKVGIHYLALSLPKSVISLSVLLPDCFFSLTLI